MKFIPIILLVALVVFIPVSFFIHTDSPKESKIDKAFIEKLAPENSMGWASESLPLGSSEATSESALKLLNLDEFVQTRYTWRGREITVYVAYWRPGKMDTRFVMMHTPDVCWVRNGWKKEEFRDSTKLDLNEFDVIPAQYRIFSVNGHREMVYFWLLVNNKLYDYSRKSNIYPNPWPFLRDFIKEMKNGKPEHLFVRISSNMTEKELLAEPLFYEILRRLEPTGICSEKVAEVK